MIDNRIVNGGFETGALAPFTGAGVEIGSNRHSGPFSALFRGGTVERRLSQVVSVAPGENFEFFVSIAKLGTAASPPVTINISYLDSRGVAIATALSIFFPSGSLPIYWREIYSTTTSAPDSAAQALVQINKHSLSGSADVVVDDVSFITVSNISTSGDLTVGGDLTVNGSTQLDGPLEVLSQTYFFGPFNVFNGEVDVASNIDVGSEILDSGKINARKLFLDGDQFQLATVTLGVTYGNIVIFGAGFGIILTAPNNTRWLLTVDNNGNLTTTPAS